MKRSSTTQLRPSPPKVKRIQGLRSLLLTRPAKKKQDVFLLNVPFSRSANHIQPRRILRNQWKTHVASSADTVLFPKPPVLVYSKGRSVLDIIRKFQKRTRLPVDDVRLARQRGG